MFVLAWFAPATAASDSSRFFNQRTRERTGRGCVRQTLRHKLRSERARIGGFFACFGGEGGREGLGRVWERDGASKREGGGVTRKTIDGGEKGEYDVGHRAGRQRT